MLRDEKREEYYEHKSYLENREYIKGAQNVKVCHQGQQFADRYSLYFPQTAFVWDIPTHSQKTLGRKP